MQYLEFYYIRKGDLIKLLKEGTTYQVLSISEMFANLYSEELDIHRTINNLIYQKCYRIKKQEKETD